MKHALVTRNTLFTQQAEEAYADTKASLKRVNEARAELLKRLRGIQEEARKLLDEDAKSREG